MIANIFLFDDFDLMDAFGPAEILGRIPEHFYLNYVSVKGGFISSQQGAKIWTDELDVEKSSDVLVIPGGKGARKVLGQRDDECVAIKKAIENADSCLMIGCGSGIAAQTGALFHRKIVDCEQYKNWNQMFTAGVSRVGDIEWMADGKFYSAKTTKSGLDMTLFYVADLIDVEVADAVAENMGYTWDYYADENYIF